MVVFWRALCAGWVVWGARGMYVSKGGGGWDEGVQGKLRFCRGDVMYLLGAQHQKDKQP